MSQRCVIRCAADLYGAPYKQTIIAEEISVIGMDMGDKTRGSCGAHRHPPTERRSKVLPARIASSSAGLVVSALCRRKHAPGVDGGCQKLYGGANFPDGTASPTDVSAFVARTLGDQMCAPYSR